MTDRQKELLEALEEILNENEHTGEVSMFTAEELGAPMDILRAELTEFGPDLESVLAEFFFIPAENEDTMFFTTVITLSSTVPKEAVPDVAAAAARIDYYLPAGSFALGENDENLIFRHTALIDRGDDIKHQTAAVSKASLTSFSVAASFFGYLLMVMKDEITVEEAVNMLKGGDAS